MHHLIALCIKTVNCQDTLGPLSCIISDPFQDYLMFMTFSDNCFSTAMFIRRVYDEQLAKTSEEDLKAGKIELCVPRKAINFS